MGGIALSHCPTERGSTSASSRSTVGDAGARPVATRGDLPPGRGQPESPDIPACRCPTRWHPVRGSDRNDGGGRGPYLADSWDPGAQTITETDPEHRVTRTALDDAGRVIAHNAPGRPALGWAYDEIGRVTAEIVGTGTAARSTTYAYDDATGTMTITLPDGSVQGVIVDRAGQAIQSATSDGATQTLRYDATGRLVQVTPPGRPTFTLGHSPGGRQTAWLPPIEPDDRSYETTSYSPDGLLAGLTGPGERSLSYAYDGAGRLVDVQSGGGRTSLRYDPTSGLISSATAPGDVTTSFGYAGTFLTAIAWTGPVQGTVSATYDAMGRLSTFAVNDAAALSMTYDAAGALTGLGDMAIVRIHRAASPRIRPWV